MLEIAFYGLCESLITLIFALGFHIIFGLGNVVFLSYGAFCVVGLYATAILFKMGLPTIFAVLLGLTFVLLLTYVFSRFILSRIQGVALNEAVVTIATMILVIEVLRMTYGSSPLTFPIIGTTDTISVGNFVFQLARLVAIPVILCAYLAVWLFLRFSTLGRSIRAIAQNRESALLMGINSDRTVNYVTLIGVFIGFVGGVIHLSFTNLTPDMGSQILLLSLLAVIMGGIGSLKGALLASFVLGFSQVLTGVSLGTKYKLLIPLMLVFLIIIFRPSGLFGIQSKLEERL